MGSITVVTGPKGCGKTTYLRDLSRAAGPPVYYLVPALELSTVDAQAAGAHTDADVFVWPSDAQPGVVLVDEPDRAIQHGLRYLDMLSFLRDKDFRVHVATHLEDVINEANYVVELQPGGTHTRQDSYAIFKMLYKNKKRADKLTPVEMLSVWGGWPFVDSRQGSGMLFQVVPPHMEGLISWFLISPETYRMMERYHERHD